MDLKEVEILGERAGEHWYYKSKSKALLKLISGSPVTSVLDVGAGSGFFSRQILAQTGAREAWCVDTSYAEDRDEQAQGGKQIHFRRSVPASGADLVLLMDVLEHVEDDRQLLSEYVNKVRPGTRFVVSVPAFQFLWSGHDVYLGHVRRYTLQGIESVMKACGLQVRTGSYYFGLVFPLAAVTRVAERLLRDQPPVRSQLRRHSALMNASLAGLCNIELPVFPRNRLVGMTAFCLAHRP